MPSLVGYPVRAAEYCIAHLKGPGVYVWTGLREGLGGGWGVFGGGGGSGAHQSIGENAATKRTPEHGFGGSRMGGWVFERGRETDSTCDAGASQQQQPISPSPSSPQRATLIPHTISPLRFRHPTTISCAYHTSVKRPVPGSVLRGGGGGGGCSTKSLDI